MCARKYAFRSLYAACGLLIFSFGMYLELCAGIGMSPWEALNQGLAANLSIQYGTASVLVSVFVLILDLLLRERIGIGTILDACLVGKGTDLFLWLDVFPKPSGYHVRLAVFLLGIVVVCMGQFVYMSAGLCCGPRDALLVGIGKRLPALPIGVLNLGIQICILCAAVLLGAPIGFGTWFGFLGTSLVMQLVFHLLRFEPRNVVHDGFADMIHPA